MEYIRKVSIGSDYKSSMNYVVGQTVLRKYTIHVIENNKNEVFLWKTFSITMPVSVEYNVNY